MIRTNTDTIIVRVMKYILIASVRLLSMESTSLEKRFVMRPKGVVSKKDIGARRTLRIARCSIVLLALVQLVEKQVDKENMKVYWRTPQVA